MAVFKKRYDRSQKLDSHARHKEMPESGERYVSAELESLQAEVGHKHLKTSQLDKKNSAKEFRFLQKFSITTLCLALLATVYGVLTDVREFLYIFIMITGALTALSSLRASFVAGRVPHLRGNSICHFLMGLLGVGACFFVRYLVIHA